MRGNVVACLTTRQAIRARIDHPGQIPTSSCQRMNHRELADTLTRLQLGVSASDLHGSLTGYLCAGGQAGAADWLDALALDADLADGQDDPSLGLLYRYCREQLDDTDLGFEPMLPGDEVAIELRAEALVEWCRGFLGGVGLAGATAVKGKVSAEASEIMQDLGTIAASNFDYAGDEEDETALAEVLEFVRVGVLLLQSEFEAEPVRRRHTPAPSRRLH